MWRHPAWLKWGRREAQSTRRVCARGLVGNVISIICGPSGEFWEDFRRGRHSYIYILEIPLWQWGGGWVDREARKVREITHRLEAESLAGIRNRAFMCVFPFPFFMPRTSFFPSFLFSFTVSSCYLFSCISSKVFFFFLSHQIRRSVAGGFTMQGSLVSGFPHSDLLQWFKNQINI